MSIYQNMDTSSTLAENLAQLRDARGLTQAALAKTAGVPRSTLAHLETGAGNPALSTLSALASALRVTIEELLTPARADCVLIRSKDLPRQERGHGSVVVRKLLPGPVPGLQIERMELLSKAIMRGVPHNPGTREYLTCLSGLLEVGVQGESYSLSAGDVLAFPGDRPHSYRNPGGTRSVALSVVVLAAPDR